MLGTCLHRARPLALARGFAAKATLPDLPYDYGALQPFIRQACMAVLVLVRVLNTIGKCLILLAL
jgi:hypothetical protein